MMKRFDEMLDSLIDAARLVERADICGDPDLLKAASDDLVFTKAAIVGVYSADCKKGVDKKNIPVV